MQWLNAWLLDALGIDRFSTTFQPLATTFVTGLLVLVISFVVNWITKKIILRVVERAVQRSRSDWDDVLFDKGVFTRLSHIAPALIVYYSAPLFNMSPGSTGPQMWVTRLATGYMAVVGIIVADAFLSSILALYERTEAARNRPIRGYIQAVKLFLYLIGGIVVVATLAQQSPWKLLSGIGALTAIILLIFRDSILGLVASIQLSANNMVRIGDWIEMPKYGADGDVIEITLQTVKVLNWDKTITTIPAYALISDSMKNWRGVFESGGRRIKRAIHIDQNSVKFLDDATLTEYEKFAFVADYVKNRRTEIAAWNEERGFDMSVRVNGRRMTNLGTFRAYLNGYLRAHPRIHQDMTFLIRQLAPSEHGIPIEIYVFTNDTAWVNYEGIQADIFDHILAVIPEFDLRVFQTPSGKDLQEGLERLS
ncbi:MAG: mechanosensitive ion channel family protein [Candidatus Poribacteria bacterium]|nr:mechanosensitive ion channel family protein [Candidatus Poribacteria bacterium]